VTTEPRLLEAARARLQRAKAESVEYKLREIDRNELREQIIRESANLTQKTWSGPNGKIAALLKDNPKLANRIASKYFNTPYGHKAMRNRINGAQLTGFHKFIKNPGGSWSMQFTKKTIGGGLLGKGKNIINSVIGTEQIVPATLYQIDKVDDIVLENSLYNWTKPMLQSMFISEGAFQQRFDSHKEPLNKLSDTPLNAPLNTLIEYRNNDPNRALERAIKKQSPSLTEGEVIRAIELGTRLQIIHNRNEK